MSIKIQEVTKLYGEQKALNHISFEAKEGEILGFLGPNGAGKSTLMKIITCYLTLSSGDVTVYGHNVKEEENEIKKIVGYLPEHNPLYLDMYVKEYLHFIAGIHGIKNKKERVEEIVNLVGLDLEKHKKIGALSKGYRQRVGLAQALIHNPKVLILDEPTTGLDPNQIVEIRNLIKKISKDKTVMLSTHIMQEVEAICDKVVIINRGEIVANDTVKNLMANSNSKEKLVFVEFENEINQKNFISMIPSVVKIEQVNHNSYHFYYDNEEGDIRKSISTISNKTDNLILSMKMKESSLEEVFKQLTN